MRITSLRIHWLIPKMNGSKAPTSLPKAQISRLCSPGSKSGTACPALLLIGRDQNMVNKTSSPQPYQPSLTIMKAEDSVRTTAPTAIGQFQTFARALGTQVAYKPCFIYSLLSNQLFHQPTSLQTTQKNQYLLSSRHPYRSISTKNQPHHQQCPPKPSSEW